MAENRGVVRWWRIANRDRVAAQCQSRLDAPAVAVVQLQQWLPRRDVAARLGAHDEADPVVNRLTDLAAARAKDVAGPADGLCLDLRQISVARRAADLATGR